MIIGQNGSGKTTILESLAVFSFGRFQSIEKDQMAISTGQEVGRVEVIIDHGGVDHKAEMAMTTSSKSMKVDDKKMPASQMVGIQRSVLFNPETIDLVSGPPHLRRRELDLTIAQNHPSHIKLLLEYRQILRQRNELLKRVAMDFAKAGELDFWDERLCDHAIGIVALRDKFINSANKKIGKIYQDLLGRNLKIGVRHLKSAHYDDFLVQLKTKRGYDIKSGLTSIGPHRDDFAFAGTDFNLREGASRGEQRLASFAFKMVERDYLAEEGHVPVLLMDDVFSELDDSRRESIVKVLDGGQIIITATGKNVIPSIIRERGKVILL